MTEQTSPPVNMFQRRHGKIVAAVASWMNDRPKDQSVTDDAYALVDCLLDQDLQIVPRCPSYAQWRVIVNGEPAQSPFNPDRQSGPLDADDAAEAFLQAAIRAEDGDAAEITVRPATDRELVLKLVGDTTLDNPAVTVVPETWAILTDPERSPEGRLLSVTDGANTVVLRLDADTMAMLGAALTDEAGGEDG